MMYHCLVIEHQADGDSTVTLDLIQSTLPGLTLWGTFLGRTFDVVIFASTAALTLSEQQVAEEAVSRQVGNVIIPENGSMHYADLLVEAIWNGRQP